jgi:hypothetical protein
MTDKHTSPLSDKNMPENSTVRNGYAAYGEGGYYEIWIKGHLEEYWSDWLGDLHIRHEEGGNTLLSGCIPDQAALHGILAQIRDLGLTLISLNQSAKGEKC